MILQLEQLMLNYAKTPEGIKAEGNASISEKRYKSGTV